MFACAFKENALGDILENKIGLLVRQDEEMDDNRNAAWLVFPVSK